MFVVVSPISVITAINGEVSPMTQWREKLTQKWCGVGIAEGQAPQNPGDLRGLAACLFMRGNWPI